MLCIEHALATTMQEPANRRLCALRASGQIILTQNPYVKPAGGLPMVCNVMLNCTVSSDCRE